MLVSIPVSTPSSREKEQPSKRKEFSYHCTASKQSDIQCGSVLVEWGLGGRLGGTGWFLVWGGEGSMEKVRLALESGWLLNPGGS